MIQDLAVRYEEIKQQISSVFKKVLDLGRPKLEFGSYHEKFDVRPGPKS